MTARSRTHAKPVSRSRLEKALATIPAPSLPRSSSPQSSGRDLSLVLVLGMHRSGTSLLSNVLHYLGADMADETDHISANNPGGFWERPDLVALQDEVLAAIGRPIASPLHSAPFPAGWWRKKEVQALKRRIRDQLEEKLATVHGWWGFKDPRTCRLLPLWKEIFDELGVRPNYVWAVRSPGEAAASMAAKNPAARPMSPEQAEITWLAYNYDALRYTLGSDPLVIEYGDWFNDPLAIGQRILRRLDLPGFSTEQELGECLRRIVNSEFRNQVEGRGDATSSMPLAQTLFGELSTLARSDTVDYGRVSGLVALLDVTFRSMNPFLELLVDMPELRLKARELEKVQDRLSSSTAQIEQLNARIIAEKERVVELKTKVRARNSQIDATESALRLREAELKELRPQIAAANERLATLDAAALSERDRAARLEVDSQRLLDSQAALEKATVDRIASVESNLAKAMEARNELLAVCDGYLARIEALKKQKTWLGRRNSPRLAARKVRFNAIPGLHGQLETIDAGGFDGWAYWPARPADRVRLAFYEGERFLGLCTANRLRRDLVKLGVGDGRSAFHLPMVEGFVDGGTRELDIRLAGTAESVLSRPVLVTVRRSAEGEPAPT